MESKKLQQLQQANSHIAPQPLPQKRPPPPFHQPGNDYRSAHSPVFQNHSQYPNGPHATSQANMAGSHHAQSPLSPIDYGVMNSVHGKPSANSYPQHLANPYQTEQLYQSSRERVYTQAPSRQHYPPMAHPHGDPVSNLQQQYQQIQQAKLQQQIQTQNEALAQQQRTFALRQQLNPPIPQTHFHMQSQSLVTTPIQSQMQQQPMLNSSHRNIPPSTLNLTSQFQPAPGPIKINNLEIRNQHYHQQDLHSQHIIQTQKIHSQTIYQQNQEIQQQINQQKLQSGTPIDQPVYIQQNHPGHVVNQACQTQITGAAGNKSKTPVEEPKTPVHQQLDRKKSAGNTQALKSPITKRPASSPVTISGWLYKQGSEGLKVWRKRWFVLSEYCLYYYKGPEEEKLLGSILLPSYRVAACSPEDKIYRKYAFKCEHTNMRTYWLAAENAETMGQWVRALTAATMMQGSSESDQVSQPSVSSLNQSGENSDSGIHTFQSQQSKLSVPHGPVTPASDSGCGSQPLYANAPPKPRRANDGGYSSPSPENSVDRCENNNELRHHQSSGQHGKRNDVKSPSIHSHAQHAQHHVIYDTRTGNVTSSIKTANIHNSSDALVNQMQQLHFESNTAPGGSSKQQSYSVMDYNKSMQTQQDMLNEHIQQAELDQHLARAQQQRFNNDDIYGERELYMQQQRSAQQQKYSSQMHPSNSMTYPSAERRTPDTYGRSKPGHTRPFSDYGDIYNLGQQQQQIQSMQQEMGAYRRPMSPPHYNNAKHIPSMPTRYPQNENIAQAVNLRPRPVPSASSVARPHSADFLEYEALAEAAQQMKRDPNRAPRPKSSLDINRTPDSFYYSEASYAEKMRQSALYLQKPSSSQSHKSAYRSQDLTPYTVGANTIAHESQYDRAKRIEMMNESMNKGALSVPRVHRPKDYRDQQTEQFLRSASARLPRKDEDAQMKDGERKREESMKRLLEWKQRMLQSPLTRKGVQQNNNSIAKLNSNPNLLSPHAIQRSRSETHANTGYNSYSSDDEASISVHNVRNTPKVNLTVKSNESGGPIDINQNMDYNNFCTGNIDPKYSSDKNYYQTEMDIHTGNKTSSRDARDHYNYHPLRKSGSRAEIDLLERETSTQIRNLDMSAGDLLSRTHEELVLLLIQLRRQNSTTARAIEQCCNDIHETQNRIRTSDGAVRAENISRLDYLKQHLLELEKQYEKSKPLVNLVDNMVKLGSLYRSNENSRQIYQAESSTLDRLEFNQKVQERRLLQEEQKQWDRLSPNHNELQSKVNQLYQLDQLLQEESGTLQSLQRDKEDLERALGGLKARLQDSNGPPIALEAAKKQQHALEKELSRVHQLLAENSKKLEQTVAGNARLEQELLVLRQKLQASRGQRGSQGALSGGMDGMPSSSSTTAVLESELRRVQQLVGDMQRQRQELSQAVKQLTENSNTLYQQIGTNDNHYSSHIKKRQSSCWTETDLDSMQSVDHTTHSSREMLNLSTPLYVDTNSANANMVTYSTPIKPGSDYEQRNTRNYRYNDSDGIESSGMESDDLLETSAFSNLSGQEKQEIKTVRIVKRESERRHRDRERSGSTTMNQNLDQVAEEDNNHNQHNTTETDYLRSKSLTRNYNETYEAIKQVKDKSSHEASKSLTLINSNSNFSSTPSIPMKYTDYFMNSSGNSYIVSMSDMNFPISPETHYMLKHRENSNSYLHNSSTNSKPELNSELRKKTESIQSLNNDMSPVFQSEAARQIMIEMSGSASEDNTEKVPLAHKHRRSIPKEKRRHYTAPNNVNVKAMQNVQTENDMNRNNTNWRARDDLDMEVALRPRINAPDVVRSALGQREKISENTIDKLLAAPSKILIPERYIPEQAPELSPEEKKRRQEKVEAIKKMLSEAPINTSNDTVSLPPSKINAEKKQREHLLQLNQILAQQVMQMSKIVAEKAMAALPSKAAELNAVISEDDHSSPTEPLPIYQQRDNFFS